MSDQNPFQLDATQKAFYDALPADGLDVMSVTEPQIVEALEALGAVRIENGRVFPVVPEPEVIPAEEAPVLEASHKAAVTEKSFATPE